MTVWAMIPVKSFEGAKSRLGSRLSPDLRLELAQAMYADTLTAIAGSSEVERLAVVTNDPEAREQAERRGADCLHDPDGGLNPALESGRTTLLSKGASTIVVLPSDIPAVRPADIDDIVRAGRERRSAVIVPDRLRQGTNALLVQHDMQLPFRFGANSFEVHLDLARAKNLPMQVLSLRHVECDCDTPEDIYRLAAIHPGPQTAQRLRAMDLALQEPGRTAP